jgi:hypothetical protein
MVYVDQSIPITALEQITGKQTAAKTVRMTLHVMRNLHLGSTTLQACLKGYIRTTVIKFFKNKLCTKNALQ